MWNKSMFNRGEQISFQAPDFSGAQFNFIGHAKKRAFKTKVHVLDTTRNTAFVLYYLNITYSFHFECVSIKSLRNKALVVWMLF